MPFYQVIMIFCAGLSEPDTRACERYYWDCMIVHNQPVLECVRKSPYNKPDDDTSAGSNFGR